jgi:hypothetical protein
MLEFLFAVLMILVIAAIYFVPALVAYGKSRKNSGAILATNLLLGWTFLGWVVALIWAMTEDK